VVVSDTGEERPRRGEERRKVYLRRLAAAAAASVVLHLVLARGLSVSSLGTPAAKDETTAGKEPLKPKRPPSDFPLEVSPSARERPAHEKPLAVAARPPKREKPARRPEPERRAATERRQDRATEEPERPQPTEAPLERTRPADTARVAPDRAAAASASETAEARADSASAAPAEAAAEARAPVPAALQPRDAEAAAVASRWRPREVELLERLASRPAVASRVARDAAADTSDSPALERRSDRGTASASDARADTLASAAPATTSRTASPAPAAVAADGRRGGRAAGRSSAASSAASAAAATATESATNVTTAPATGMASARPARSAAAAGGAAASRPRVVTSGPATGVASAGVAAPATSGASGSSAPAPAAAALDTAARGGRSGGARATSGGGGRGGSGAVGAAGDEGDASGSGASGAASGGWVGSASVARGGGGGGTSGSGEATTPARAAALAGGGAGGAGTADTIATGPAGGPGGAAAVAMLPGPAALGRIGGTGRGTGAAGLAGSGAGGSALGAGRRGGGDGGAGDDGEEGLSVGIGDGGAIAGGGRPRGGDDAGLPARIAAAALPVEGRVRDVAEAFAGRTAGGVGEPRTAKVVDPERARRADAMVDRGLDFLARSQQADGRWSLGKFAGATRADVPKLESDTAATGLALLSFLGAGHDHFGGRYRDTVRRGLEFLLAVQKPDGDLFLPADDLSNSCAWLYSHGIASMAVCEAVGMTGDPLVKPAAEKACRFIAASQHPQLGGWRYTPRSDADLSVSGWMLVAVRSGQLAGVKTDPATLPGVRRLVEAAASRDDATRYAYNPRKQDQRRSRLSAACMTAVGGLMRLHTGDRADDPRLVAAGKFLATIEPSYGTSADKVRDSYLWYYASQVLVHTAGPDWDRWYARLVDTLAAHQETAGPKGGSWDPLAPQPDRWGEYGGRIYVTALHLLALEVPYRHLPTTSIGER
jgi:hypothetical protein